MSRAVVEIEPGAPQRRARQRVDLRAVRSRRKDRAGDRDVAFQHAREAVAHQRGRPPDRDRARDVGRAVLVLRAAVDEKDAALDFAVGRLADPVMRDGGIGASGGDRRERQVLERRARAPEGLQSLDGVDLRQTRRAAPRRRTRRGNVAIAAPSRSCAARAPASSTGFFFAFMSVIGSAPISALPPARSIAWVKQAGDGRGVEGDARALPAQILDELEQSVGLQHVRMTAERLRGSLASACVRRETATGRPLSGTIGPAERQRRIGDVRAADVEEPREIVRIADREARATSPSACRTRAIFAAVLSPAKRRLCGDDRAQAARAADRARSRRSGCASTATSAAPAFSQAAA